MNPKGDWVLLKGGMLRVYAEGLVHSFVVWIPLGTITNT